MGVIAEFELEAKRFAFADALETSGVDRIEFERVVPDRTGDLSFLWVWGPNAGGLERSLRDDAAVSTVAAVETFDDATLYRVEWRTAVPGLARAVSRGDAHLLSGVGEDDAWTFELRLPDRDAFRRFADVLETDLDVSPNDLCSLSRVDVPLDYGLTPRQRSILRTAARRGYFDEPRSVSLEEIADEFDISAPSASGLLRRGTARLLESTLLDDPL